MCAASPDEPVGFVNWAEGQPDHGPGEEDCVEIWTTGEWNDCKCAEEKAYACTVQLAPDQDFECSEAMASDLRAIGKDPAATRCRYYVGNGGGDARTYAASHQMCGQLGGIIAEPRTPEHCQLIAFTLRRLGADSVWLGASFWPSRKWHWDSGAHALVQEHETRWAQGQPDGDGKCIELLSDSTWNDRDCTVEKAYACEVPVEKPPPPPPPPLGAVDPDAYTAMQSAGAEWRLHAGVNCFSAEGAEELGDDDAAVEDATVESCLQLCLREQRCDSVVMPASVRTGGATGGCYLRSNTEISQCGVNDRFDVYLRAT